MQKQLPFLFFLLMCVVISNNSIAQQIDIVANPGTSATPALGTSNYVANEAIYTEAELGASNFTTLATSINSIGFSVGTVGTNTTFNNVNIYMKDVPLTSTTFTAGTYTNAGYTLVFSGSITITATGFTEFALTTPYVRTPGTNLQVLIERTDNVAHASWIWNCANGNNTSSTINTTRRYNGTVALSGTTNLAVSAFRQAMRFSHKFNNDANVQVYTLGKIPLVFGNGNHVVKARVFNAGFNALNNINVTLNVTGANTFNDVQTITTLNPGAEQIVSFNGFTPTVLGANNVSVYLSPDDFTGNDTSKWDQQVTTNLFSYKNPNVANQPGGIGFNGATGQFVAKYTLTTGGDINEIKVDFTTSGQPYQIGIWDATGTGGQPGALLWTSQTYNTTPGTAFVPVSPQLNMAAGDFYIGVRQMGTLNVGFGYQTESPIRPSTFYYTTLNGTSWTAFAGAQPFRFAIEAQMYVPQPPNCATAFNPADKATTVDAFATTNLTWLSGGGGATDYDVYFGTTYPPPYFVNTTATSLPVTLAPSTTYYWHVLAKNAIGSAVGCDTLEFKTGCPIPNTLNATNITTNSADLQWIEPWTSTQWEINYGPGTTFTAGTGTSIFTTSNPYSLTINNPTTSTYSYFVRSICAPGDTSVWSVRDTIDLLLGNDDAFGALPITVGAGCTGSPYTNATATQNTLSAEPYPSCNNTSTGHHTTWYKFIAPASGGVRVSTDILPGGTLTDTKIALFSATDSSDYSTFNIISCDEDGGVNLAVASILYATSLTPGVTYYVQVDGYATTNFGTFCLTVDELTSTMVASTAGNCVAMQTPFSTTTTSYTGWVPLMNNNGQLIALVRNSAGGAPSNYTGSLTITTGTPRQDGNQYYLNRNFLINNSSITTAVDLRLFFTASELSALAGLDGNATLPNLNVTHQSGATCQANHNSANGTNNILMQATSGTVNAINWIEVQPSSFSNFYIMSGANPLVIRLGEIIAANVGGTSNKVEWNTLSEKSSDRFELERSLDGKNFLRIHEQRAKGEAGRYTYMDNNALKGENFYRLRMIDGSGNVGYSKVVSAVAKSSGFDVEAFPNPVSQNLTVKVSGVQGTGATIQVVDVTGKLMKTVKMNSATEIINMSGLANGIYLIKYSDASNTQTIRVNKQ